MKGFLQPETYVFKMINLIADIKHKAHDRNRLQSGVLYANVGLNECMYTNMLIWTLNYTDSYTSVVKISV